MEPRDNRRLTLALVLVGVCVLAFAFAMLTLRSTTMAAAGTVGIVGIILLFVEPFIGLVNYLILLFIRPQDFVPGLVGKPIMLLLGMGTAVIVILHKAVVKRHLTIAKAPHNVFILWFYAAIVVSKLATLNLGGAVSATMDWVSVLVMYLLITNLVTSQARFRFVFKLVCLLTLALAVQGIVQSITGFGLGGKESYKGRVQAIGIFSDPNDLALLINCMFPLTLLTMLESARPSARLIALIFNAVFLYVVILTQSRGGLLSFGVLMIILFARKYGRIVGIAGGGFIMLALVALGPRMSSISTNEDSAYGRVEAWALGLDLFQMRPLFGVGYDNFLEYHFRTAHNSFVLCATELGMFGLVPWVMMIYLTIRHSRFIATALRAEGDRRGALYAEALEYAMITFTLGAYFLSRTYHELLFILIAMSAAQTHMFVAARPNDRFQLVSKRDFVNVILCIAGLWALTKLFLFSAW